MFETSKDILYLVISFSILWLTVFLCWSLYHLGKVLKNAHEIIEEFRVRLQTLMESVDYVKSKVEQISHLMTLATSGLGGLVKKVGSEKAEEWFNGATEDMGTVARTAVRKAAKTVAKKTSSVAKKVKAKSSKSKSKKKK